MLGQFCLNHTIEKEGEGDALKENSDASPRGESVLSMSSPSLSSAVVSVLWPQWAGKLFNPQSTSNKFCFESGINNTFPPSVSPQGTFLVTSAALACLRL